MPEPEDTTATPPPAPGDAPSDAEVDAIAADLVRRYADALDRLGR